MSDIFSGIASLTKTVQETLNSYEVRKISDKVQSYVMNFTETEMKVREATTEEPWGPTPDMMREVAGLTFQYDAFPEVMAMLWKRMLPPSPVAWRHTYKALILLEYLLKNGCERVISNARDHAFEMRSLERYKCIDERGKDQGVNVRHRVKAVLNLLEDDDTLREERRKAKIAGKDDKYRGYSRDDMIMRGGMSSYSSNRNNSRYDDLYDRDNRYDDVESKKEVTSFGFDDDKRSVSPELGIRIDSPVDKDADDDFGDFTVARSNANKTTTETKTKNSSFDFGDFGAALPPPPGTSAIKSNTNNKIVDDLFSPSEPPQKKNDEFDLFGLNDTSTNSSVIRPPSGPSSPSTDLFNLNDKDDLFPTSSNVSKPQQQDAFDFLGLSSPQQPTVVNNSFIDSIPNVQNNDKNKSDDLFAVLGSSAIQKTPEEKSFEQKTTETKNKEQNKSALWNDLSGRLDLDNLLSTKPKQSISMNEMRSKQGMSNSNSFM